LFANPAFPASTQPVSGPIGFEALFSNPDFAPISQSDSATQDFTQHFDLPKET
jgi:hypothetical protein